ncbi:hypothetical protein IAR50_002993 [Cryptococcus sp. DSM 104548]
MNYYNQNQPPMMGAGGGMGMPGQYPPGGMGGQYGMSGMGQQPLNPMMTGGGMASGMAGMNGGMALNNLGYDYKLPSLDYVPRADWSPWDLANAQYNGSHLDRGFFNNIVRLCREYQDRKNKDRSHLYDRPPTPPSPPPTPHVRFGTPHPRRALDSSLDPPAERNILPSTTIQKISTLTNFFTSRHLSEEAARDAHRRVYYAGEGADTGNKTLGGAAAYQAYLIWDRDHYSAYHANPTQENRERLVGLAVAELFSLWDRVLPRSTRASIEDASQYAAATAKHLFDRHYDIDRNRFTSYNRSGGSHHYGYREDGESDVDDRNMRRRSMYGQQASYGPGGSQPPQHMMGMNGGLGQMGQGGMPGQMGQMGMQPGMQGGMMQGGMMQGGSMGGMNGMGMGGYGGGYGGGMGGMPGMGAMGMGGMGTGMGGMGGGMGLAQGVPPHGSFGESQAAPGMHPYHFGSQSGVAWGNQPIDSGGHNTFLGGPQRSWYGYGQQQPRYF